MATLYVDVRTLTAHVPPSPKILVLPRELSSSGSCTSAVWPDAAQWSLGAHEISDEYFLRSSIYSETAVLGQASPATHSGGSPGTGEVLSPYTTHRDFAIQGSVTTRPDTACSSSAPNSTSTTYDGGMINVLGAEST